MDGALEDAARVAAPPARVLLRIVLPAAAPAIALAALLIFTLALSELWVPMFLRVDAYPAAVFARLADRVAVLEEGRVVQGGTLDELRRAPATPFVQATTHHAIDL